MKFNEITGCEQTDYINERFEADMGTEEWSDEAMARYHRAQSEFIKAVQEMMMVSTTALQTLVRRRAVIEKVDNLARAKWLQVEVVKYLERAPVKVSICDAVSAMIPKDWVVCDGPEGTLKIGKP